MEYKGIEWNVSMLIATDNGELQLRAVNVRKDYRYKENVEIRSLFLLEERKVDEIDFNLRAFPDGVHVESIKWNKNNINDLLLKLWKQNFAFIHSLIILTPGQRLKQKSFFSQSTQQDLGVKLTWPVQNRGIWLLMDMKFQLILWIRIGNIFDNLIYENYKRIK